jgi:hypothetical protein
MKSFISQGVLSSREVDILYKDIKVYRQNTVTAQVTNSKAIGGDGYDPNARECQIHLVDYNKFPATAQILQSLLIENYRSIYKDLDYSAVSDFQYVSYKKGDFFKKHQDVVTFEKVARVLTMSINISDDSEYVGGDLLIYDGDKVVERCRRERGSFVIFPAFIHHEATLVTRGHREAIVTWLNNEYSKLNTFKTFFRNHMLQKRLPDK